MHNVFKGIVVGVLGFFFWFLSSVVEGLARVGGEPTATGSALMYLGFLLMVGGPVVYILVMPVASRLREGG